MDADQLRLRTLIVDDDTDSAFLTRRVLSLTGCFEIVGEAHDAHEARLLAEAKRPDLVLLDVELPGADGFAALPFIQEAAPRSHIVMLSGADPDRTRHRAAALQVDYVAKGSGAGVFEMLAHALLGERGTHATH